MCFEFGICSYVFLWVVNVCFDDNWCFRRGWASTFTFRWNLFMGILLLIWEGLLMGLFFTDFWSYPVAMGLSVVWSCLIQAHWKMGHGEWFFKICHYLRLRGGGSFGYFMWKQFCLAFLIYSTLMFQIFKNLQISRLEVGSNTPTPPYYPSQTVWLNWTIMFKRAFMLIGD